MENIYEPREPGIYLFLEITVKICNYWFKARVNPGAKKWVHRKTIKIK